MGVCKDCLKSIPVAQELPVWKKGTREKWRQGQVNISKIQFYTCMKMVGRHFVHLPKNFRMKNGSKFIQEEKPFLCGGLSSEGDGEKISIDK